MKAKPPSAMARSENDAGSGTPAMSTVTTEPGAALNPLTTKSSPTDAGTPIHAAEFPPSPRLNAKQSACSWESDSSGGGAVEAM